MDDKNITAAAGAVLSGFVPAPMRTRLDGWTPQRQCALIAALAAHGRVARACREIGLSATSAYRLYNRADAASLRDAWDRALESHHRARLAARLAEIARRRRAKICSIT